MYRMTDLIIDNQTSYFVYNDVRLNVLNLIILCTFYKINFLVYFQVFLNDINQNTIYCL